MAIALFHSSSVAGNYFYFSVAFVLMGKKLNLNDIVTCCKSCFNRGLATNWKHSDFTALNFEILRETGVNISPNTLKRIFGKIAVDDDYWPQQATIDALIQYGGYVPSIIEARAEEHVIDEPTVELNMEQQLVTVTNPRLRKKFKSWLIVFSLVILAICSLIFKTLKSKGQLSGTIEQTTT